LGKYTYGLYMLHPIAIWVIDILVKLIYKGTQLYWILGMKGIVSFFLSLALAKFSYHVLEVPFLKLKERFTVVKNKTLKVA
jgi:peptidoglycan/LPS O-acetylase OafA/YrhL